MGLSKGRGRLLRDSNNGNVRGPRDSKKGMAGALGILRDSKEGILKRDSKKGMEGPEGSQTGTPKGSQAATPSGLLANPVGVIESL